MKKIYFLLVTIFFVISSCQEYENLYSCDPDINSWVKSNLSEISLMGREDIIVKNNPVQIAIFRAFSSQQRLQVWLDKLDEVVKLDWSTEEKAHIMSIRNALKEEWFSDEFRKDSVKFQPVNLFEKDWCLEGIKKFGWTQQLITSMVGRLEKLIDKQGNLKVVILKSANVAVETSAEGCTCNVAWDMCGGPFGISSCHSTSCTQSPWGCGMLFGYYCDGECFLL